MSIPRLGGKAVVLLGWCCLLGPATARAETRFYLASQDDWGGRHGFYLNFEGNELKTLRLALGIADGRAWRFIGPKPGFQSGREHHIVAVIAPGGARLLLDGKTVGESPGRWSPCSGALKVNHRPTWVEVGGDWLCVVSQIVVTLSRDGTERARREFDFRGPASRPAALQLLQPGTPESWPLEAEPSDTLTVDVHLRLLSGDLKDCSPLIDRYGQCRLADWPEKIHNDDDLKENIAEEDKRLAEMPPSTDFDPCGGYLRAGWRGEAKGFFHVVRRGGMWWLITPKGNPCFYLGVSSMPASGWPTTPVTGREFMFEWLPPRDGPLDRAWSANHWGQGDTQYVCFHTCNLIRKYGPDAWAHQSAVRSVRRIRAWGFSGGGKWSASAGLVSIPVLNAGDTPRLGRHPDVFDAKVRETFVKALEKQIAPRRDDPVVLGWSFGNEYDEIVTKGEILDVLSRGAEVPAKRALVDHAIDTIHGGDPAQVAKAWKVEAATREALYASKPAASTEDVEALRRCFADRYYAFIYESVKKIDPNHLFLGNWIVYNWWENEEDWRLIARHCDVIGHDYYSRGYHHPDRDRLVAETDKPMLIGEFSLPPWYGGRRGYGRYDQASAEDEAEAGALYHQWVQDAAKDRHCIGLVWFQYRDQPLTGRGPGRGPKATFGEHYAFGLITVTDQPKWPMVERMRAANLSAAQWRMAATLAH